MMRDYIEWAISEAPIIEQELRDVPEQGLRDASDAAWRIAQARAEENFKEHMAKARAQAWQKELNDFKEKNNKYVASIEQVSAEICAKGQYTPAATIKKYHEKFGGTPSVKNAGKYQDFQDYLENNQRKG